MDGIVKTVDLVEHNNRFAIIEKDFDGISVRELIKSKKIGVKLFSQIAEKVSGTLGKLGLLIDDNQHLPSKRARLFLWNRWKQKAEFHTQ